MRSAVPSGVVKCGLKPLPLNDTGVRTLDAFGIAGACGQQTKRDHNGGKRNPKSADPLVTVRRAEPVVKRGLLESRHVDR